MSARMRTIVLALLLLSLLAGCAGRAAETPETGEGTPTVTPTPWPTLSVPATLTATPEGTPAPDVTPTPPKDEPVANVLETVDHFRAEVQTGLTGIYPLEGRLESPVRVEVIVLSGEVDPVITIIGPRGDELAVSDSGGVGEPEVIGQFLFPADGYYELGIGSLEGSGEVGVSVYRLGGAELEGGGTFNSLSQELRAVMDHPATFHTFRLPVERGQRFDLGAEALTGDLDLVFDLYAPDGTLIVTRDDNVDLNPYVWNYLPAQSGTYTVVVSNFGETTGEYVLRVTPSEGGEQAVVGTRTETAVQGVPRRSTWLRLEGRALTAVYVEARPLDPGVDLDMALYDPFGNQLTRVNQTAVGGEETLTLVQFPFDGEYQLEFSTLNESGRIEYYIRGVGSEALEESGLIGFARTLKEGEMEGPGTVITYAFNANAGDLVGVDAHPVGIASDLDLGFDLYAPDGTRLVSLDDVIGKDPVLDRLELPMDGRYAITLWNFGGTTGPFEILVANPDAPATPPPDANLDVP